MHSIKFNNVKQNEEFGHQLILLKGTIIGLNPPKTIAVNAKNLEPIAGNFKALIELKEGVNNIIITCCCRSFELRLVYKPRDGEKRVVPLYIICRSHMGSFQAPPDQPNNVNSAFKRINTACKILQCVLAEKLHELNFGRKSFIADPCQVFESDLFWQEALEMTQQKLWKYFAREIMNSEFYNTDVKYLAFLSCTRYDGELYDPDMNHQELIETTTAGYVALGGGGLALFGTACLYTWAEDVEEILERFEDGELVDKSKFLDDSAYRGTLGACYSTTLGSVLHELCHTFNLGHTAIGIMGRGFDDLRNIFLNQNHGCCVQRNSSAEVLNPGQEFDHLRNMLMDKNRGCCVESSDVGKTDEQVRIEVGGVQRNSFIRNTEFSAEVLNKPVCVDDIFFTRSGATVLAYHKWFNNFEESKGFVLSFDGSLGLVRSTLGIRVIEVRKDDDEMVVLNWYFQGKVLKYNFVIDLHWLDIGAYKIFVQDNLGYFIKVNYQKS